MFPAVALDLKRAVSQNGDALEAVFAGRARKEIRAARHAHGGSRLFRKIGAAARKAHHQRMIVRRFHAERAFVHRARVNGRCIFNAQKRRAGCTAGRGVERALPRIDEIRRGDGRGGRIIRIPRQCRDIAVPDGVFAQMKRKLGICAVCLPAFGNAGLGVAVFIQAAQPLIQRADQRCGVAAVRNLRVERRGFRRKQKRNRLRLLRVAAGQRPRAAKEQQTTEKPCQ